MKNLILIFALFSSLFCLAQAPNWFVFNHTNAPFVSDSITWVEVDTNNVKWVGTTNGLYSFYNNTWTTYNTSNSTLPSNRISQFKIAYDNSIYFLNHNNGFIKYKNNVFTHYNKANTPAMRTDSLVGLTIDSNEVYFWSNYDGIIRYNALTNTVSNIDTTNSYLKNIATLQYHNNHTLYGLGNGFLSQPPTNRKDSIDVSVFVISTTPTLSISYCYEYNNLSGGGIACQYNSVKVDKLQNREEYRTINSFGDTKRRLYDKNNNLISDINFNYEPYYQVLHASDGDYKLYRYFNSVVVERINTPYGEFHMVNSVIPDLQIIRFDTDKYNNLWLATPKGLVGFNNTGLVLSNNDLLFSSDNIKIYPNPTNEFLEISYLSDEPVNIQITNTLGRVVKSLNIILTSTTKIKLENLNSGLYYLTLRSRNGAVTKKIFKE